jgi:CRP/FNR family transcriptional regulator
MTNRTFHALAGAMLFRPEEDCPGYVRVLSGGLKVVLSAANGREIVLYRVRPGDVA